VRVFFDANIYISYLLNPSARTPPTLVARAGLMGRFTLLMSQTVVTEIREKTTQKPYLASKIRPEDVAEFVALLTTATEAVPELSEPFPEVGDDRKDDYLFAHALIGQANFLVSGDAGVVRIGQIDAMQIVSPAQFLAILHRSNET
jgi:putative PIN family toxin of toxin-antitoxin system